MHSSASTGTFTGWRCSAEYILLYDETLKSSPLVRTSDAGPHGYQFLSSRKIEQAGNRSGAQTIVGDDRDLLREAFRDALNRVPLIVSSADLARPKTT